MLFNIVNFVICLTVEWCYQHNRKGRFPWQMAKSYHWNGGEVPDRGFLCHQWNSTHCPFFVQKVHWITHSNSCIPPPHFHWFFSLQCASYELNMFLFSRYRHEFKSQKLWEEIKFVLENFAKPFTELFNVRPSVSYNMQDNHTQNEFF